MSWKSGSLNLLESSGPHRACYGILSPFYSRYYLFSPWNVRTVNNFENLTEISVLKLTLGLTSESDFYTSHVRSLRHISLKTTYKVLTAQVTPTLLNLCLPTRFYLWNYPPPKIQSNIAVTSEKYHMEELDVDDRLILKFIAIFVSELRHAIDWTCVGNDPMGNVFWYVSVLFSLYQSGVYPLTGHLSAVKKAL